MLILLLACGAGTQATPAEPAPVQKAAYHSVDLATFKADFFGGKVPVVVDVRTAEEFAGGHVPGAQNIPLDRVESEVGALDKYKSGEVFLICESGGRSARASQVLADRGFNAVNVMGGTYAWREAGLPLEK